MNETQVKAVARVVDIILQARARRLDAGDAWVQPPVVQPGMARRDEQIGHVYFMRAIDGGPIKIGFTNNLKRRLREVQKTVTSQLCILATVTGGYELEISLHDRFAKHRLQGEWFTPAPELLAYIAEIA